MRARALPEGSLSRAVTTLSFGSGIASRGLLGFGAAGRIDPSGAYVLADGLLVAQSGLMFYRLVTAPIAEAR